jgi:hypothetical protein
MKVTVSVHEGGIEVTDPKTGNSVSWFYPADPVSGQMPEQFRNLGEGSGLRAHRFFVAAQITAATKMRELGRLK